MSLPHRRTDWGLRDYGIPPTVWGGEGAGCEHVWGEHQTGRVTGSGDRPPDNKWPGCPSPDSQTVRSFCQLCGAWSGNLGLEPAPELYVAHLVEVFREVWRVLRDDGAMWLNLGDTHWGGKGQNGQAWSTEHQDRPTLQKAHHQIAGRGETRPQDHYHSTIKPKDLVGIPWAVAFALRGDGWYLRQAVIWHKPNCMPESVKDRPTTDYEFVFLLAKSEQYFYDAVAIMEPVKPQSVARGERRERLIERMGAGALGKQQKNLEEGDGYQHAYAGLADGRSGSGMNLNGRNKRAVWTIPVGSFSEDHFATFPPALVEPCVKAGTSERGACPECGAPWERVVEKEFVSQQDVSPERGIKGAPGQKPMDKSSGWEGVPRGTNRTTTIGFRPTCDCPEHEPVPCRILDPFGGAGTTGMVADRLGRDAVLIDIKPEYAEMSRERIVRDAGPMFAQVKLLEG